MAPRRRRRRLWIGMLGLLAIPALVLLFFCSARTQITEANCDRIHEGMTQEEVEALLGGPPQGTALGYGQGRYGDDPRADPRFGKCCWWADDPEDCNIEVLFDGNGKVQWAKFGIP